MQFGSSDICGRCSKAVYSAEKVRHATRTLTLQMGGESFLKGDLALSDAQCP
jgi:hypothetical protein